MKRIAPLVVIFILTLVAVLPTPFRGQVQAQGSTVWFAEYYNNEYLIGSPAFTRQEGNLQLNWGTNAPGSGVNADNWSARFAADPYFQDGTYRFYILADDGVKLWIDFPPDKKATIDTYNAPKAGVTLTADVTLTAGYHHIQVDFREMTGDAYLYVSWEKLSGGSTSGPGFPVPPQSLNINSWTAQYYNNGALAGAPVVTQVETSPTHNWGVNAPVSGVPADLFSARWTAYPTLNAGTYTITAQADDGVRVYVNGVMLINEFHGASGQTYTNTFNLQAGQHSFVVEYYDYQGNAFLNFNVTLPSSTSSPTTPAGGPTLTVTAYRLNVRSAPRTGEILTKVNRNQVFNILGRNADSSWWQISANGVTGWVSGAYVRAANVGNVPVTWGNTTGQTCPGFLASRLIAGSYGRVLPGDPNNMRSAPNFGATVLGQIPAGAAFYVVAGPTCGDNGAWWQVYYNGVSGWTLEGQYSSYWLEPI